MPTNTTKKNIKKTVKKKTMKPVQVAENEPIKIDWDESFTGCLNQGLSGGIEFALVSKDNAQCGPFAYCKDYMQDAIAGTINKKSMSIFGYSYEPSWKNQPCLDAAKFLIGNASDPKMREKIPAVADFTHQFEDKLVMPHSTFRECKNPNKKFIRSGVFLIEGDKRWINSPVMVSLYTLLIRVGFVHTLGKPYTETIDAVAASKVTAYQSIDNSRMRDAKPGIQKILERGDLNIFHEDIKQNYPSTVDVSTMHNSMGIIAFSGGSTKTSVPYWHREGK